MECFAYQLEEQAHSDAAERFICVIHEFIELFLKDRDVLRRNMHHAQFNTQEKNIFPLLTKEEIVFLLSSTLVIEGRRQ